MQIPNLLVVPPYDIARSRGHQRVCRHTCELPLSPDDNAAEKVRRARYRLFRHKIQEGSMLSRQKTCVLHGPWASEGQPPFQVRNASTGQVDRHLQLLKPSRAEATMPDCTSHKCDMPREFSSVSQEKPCEYPAGVSCSRNVGLLCATPCTGFLSLVPRLLTRVAQALLLSTEVGSCASC